MPQKKGELRRERLLGIIEDKGGSATTAELKDATGWDGSLIGHHMRTLRGIDNTDVGDVDANHPQVEVEGTEAREGRQIDMNIYRITDVGRERLERTDIPIEDLLDNRTLEDLRRDLRELEDEFEGFREGHNKLVGRLEDAGVI